MCKDVDPIPDARSELKRLSIVLKKTQQMLDLVYQGNFWTCISFRMPQSTLYMYRVFGGYFCHADFAFPTQILVATYSKHLSGHGDSGCLLLWFANHSLKLHMAHLGLAPSFYGRKRKQRISPSLLKHRQTWNVSSVTTKDASSSVHLLLRSHQCSLPPLSSNHAVTGNALRMHNYPKCGFSRK